MEVSLTEAQSFKALESTTICIGGISLKGSILLLISLERNES